MRLDSLFSKENIERVFSKNSIKVSENFEFSNINIIIGPNGAGKTRFLNAIKELYNDQDVKMIYSYFPTLSSYKAPPEKEIPDCSIKEYYSDENAIDFSDFFQEIEFQCNWTFQDLLHYHSKRDKEKNEELLNIIKNIFFEFTQKDLIVQKKKFFVKVSKNESHLLSEELEHMSPGERVLLYMSIFIAIQKKYKKEKVIILDEPECHLHPKALISFINLLKKRVDDDVTCWIATHSLFLIPEFEFENIVCINSGKIQNRTSQLYYNIFSDMLGDKDGKVKTFFSSLPYWQYSDFICKCFTTPDVIETVDPEDEQVRLFREYLHGSEKKTFRVLDWGGGSGRLGSSLEAVSSEKRKDFCYEIYDPNPVCKDDKFKVYTDPKDISGSYDCIVMMNVLHEINPIEWYDLFSKIHQFLKKDAYLFFVEVKVLSQGEMPNEEGYFVLGKSELEILFQNKELIDFTIKSNTEKGQKSSCILIPQKSLSNISFDTIQETIQHLKNRMLDEIKLYRNTNITGKQCIGGANGRKYAFLLQQYMNATLYIEQYIEKANQISKLQVKLTKIEVKYERVSCYGGKNVKWKGKKSLTDKLYKQIKDSARSFSSMFYNNKEYLLINLCHPETLRDDMVIVFDSLESEIKSSVDISDAYLERVYSLYYDESLRVNKSFLDEEMNLNVHMHFNGNIMSVPIAYACPQNGSTSVLLQNIVSSGDAQNKKTDLIETPDEAGSIIGFLETAYCVKCITSMGEEFYYSLYMALENKENLKHELSIGEDDYIKHYEKARKDMGEEIEINKKYN